MALTLTLDGIPAWHGQPLRLPPKERTVLALLVRRQPDAVSKDEIAQHAWPGDDAVSDHSIGRCVSQLRRCLPQVRIESVYGYGYKLLLPEATVHGRLLEVSQAPVAVAEKCLHALSLVQQRTPTGLARALETLRAVAQDSPGYAPVRIALAQTIGVAVGHGVSARIGVDISEAWAHLDIAYRLCPDAQGLKAVHAWLCDMAWRFDEAERLYLEALDGRPGTPEVLQPYGWHLIATGRPGQAIEAMRAVLAQRPYSVHGRVILAGTLERAGHGEEALREIGLARQAHPGDPMIESAHVSLLASLAPEPGLIEPARRLGALEDLPPFSRVCYPYVLARCGRRDEARREVEAALARPGADLCERMPLSAALLELGEPDRAAGMIVAAYRAGCGWLPAILRAPRHAPLLRRPDVRVVFRDVFATVEDGLQGPA